MPTSQGTNFPGYQPRSERCSGGIFDGVSCLASTVPDSLRDHRPAYSSPSSHMVSIVAVNVPQVARVVNLFHKVTAQPRLTVLVLHQCCNRRVSHLVADSGLSVFFRVSSYSTRAPPKSPGSTPVHLEPAEAPAPTPPVNCSMGQSRLR